MNKEANIDGIIEIASLTKDDQGIEFFRGVVATDLFTLDDCLRTLGIEVQDKKVIEFGSGRGGPCFLFNALGAEEVIGIEIDEEVRKKAESARKDLGIDEKAVRFLDPSQVDLAVLFSQADIVYSYPLHGNMTWEFLSHLARYAHPDQIILVNTFTNKFEKQFEDRVRFNKNANKVELVGKSPLKFPNLIVVNYVVSSLNGEQTNILVLRKNNPAE